MGRGNEVECDPPIVENVDNVVVLVAINAGTIEKLKARSILFIKRLSEFGEVEFSIQLAVFVEHLLRRLEAVVLVIPFLPVLGHVRVPEGLSVDVKRLKRVGRFVVVFNMRIKPLVGVECLKDGDLAIHVASG